MLRATPARTNDRTAVRRKSWNKRFGMSRGGDRRFPRNPEIADRDRTPGFGTPANQFKNRQRTGRVAVPVAPEAPGRSGSHAVPLISFVHRQGGFCCEGSPRSPTSTRTLHRDASQYENQGEG